MVDIISIIFVQCDFGHEDIQKLDRGTLNQTMQQGRLLLICSQAFFPSWLDWDPMLLFVCISYGVEVKQFSNIHRE